jgi:hypothetical protein
MNGTGHMVYVILFWKGCCYAANLTDVALSELDPSIQSSTDQQATLIQIRIYDSDVITSQSTYNATIHLPDTYKYASFPEPLNENEDTFHCYSSTRETMKCNGTTVSEALEMKFGVVSNTNTITLSDIEIKVVDNVCEFNEECSRASIVDADDQNEEEASSGNEEDDLVYLGPFGYVSKPLAIGIGIGFGLILLLVLYLVLQRTLPSRSNQTREGGGYLTRPERRRDIRPQQRQSQSSHGGANADSATHLNRSLSQTYGRSAGQSTGMQSSSNHTYTGGSSAMRPPPDPPVRKRDDPAQSTPPTTSAPERVEDEDVIATPIVRSKSVTRPNVSTKQTGYSVVDEERALDTPVHDSGLTSRSTRAKHRPSASENAVSVTIPRFKKPQFPLNSDQPSISTRTLRSPTLSGDDRDRMYDEVEMTHRFYAGTDDEITLHGSESLRRTPSNGTSLNSASTLTEPYQLTMENLARHTELQKLQERYEQLEEKLRGIPWTPYAPPSNGTIPSDDGELPDQPVHRTTTSPGKPYQHTRSRSEVQSRGYMHSDEADAHYARAYSPETPDNVLSRSQSYSNRHRVHSEKDPYAHTLFKATSSYAKASARAQGQRIDDVTSYKPMPVMI